VSAAEGGRSQRWWTRWRSDACPVMALEGVLGDSVPTTMAAGCVPLGWRPSALPVIAFPGTGCVARDGARMPDSHTLAVRPRQSRG
jgi:hypothetical protein